jgi:predicted RNA-binding protein YlxR (DUF448 family)
VIDVQEARAARKGHEPERTCIGCGKADAREHLVRVVVGPQGEVAFDLAGGAFGRGAHVHPSLSCLEKAASKGLSRSFGVAVHCDGAALSALLVEAADRRIEGLLSSAARSGLVVIGFESVDTALVRDEVVLAVVARDAGGCASSRSIQQAVSEGRAVAWGTKAVLASLVCRVEVSVLGIRSSKIGASVLMTCRAADGARSVSEVR